MPITAERFDALISTAEYALQVMDQCRENLELTREALSKLKRELPNDLTQDAKDLVATMEYHIDSGLEARFSLKDRTKLISEREKFNLNEKKNRSQKFKMRMKREGLIPTVPRKKKWTTEEMIEDTKQYEESQKLLEQKSQIQTSDLIEQEKPNSDEEDESYHFKITPKKIVEPANE